MLSITSDDGNRGRLAATSGQTSWARGSENANAVTHLTSTLRAGGNDLAIDYNQVGGKLALRVQLDGPDFSNTEAPRDRLRPVETVSVANRFDYIAWFRLRKCWEGMTYASVGPREGYDESSPHSRTPLVVGIRRARG